jgi:hypothetical protein
MARSGKHLAPMELTPQSDAVNRDWAARYRRLAGL